MSATAWDPPAGMAPTVERGARLAAVLRKLRKVCKVPSLTR